MDGRNAGRIAELQEKLDARDKKPGFKKNCAELRAEIARLQAEDEAPRPAD